MKAVLRFFVSAVCGILCILYVPVDPGGELVAGGAYDLGSVVEQTPFDLDLASAGFFNETYVQTLRTPSAETAERLFRQARLFRYSSDKTYRGRWQSAKETDVKHSGNCIDKALWLYAALKKNGYRHVRLVIGKFRPVDSKLHAWIIYVNDSGDTYLLDSTIQHRPWKVPEFSNGQYQPIYSFDGKNRYMEFGRL